MTKVLAISSGGGHWVQLQRVVAALRDCEVVFATVAESYRQDVPGHRFHTVCDATRWNKLKLLKQLWGVWRILRKERPEVVISTGAAPGYFAIRIGRGLGLRTVWLDSIANVECLSMSGQRVGKYADLWLTQWAHLARPDGPHFAGAVL